MGVGRLDIGEGIGGAQVFNPMPAIQQYGQMLQQRQAKHDNEVKQLGDELAKGYDPSGLRNDADRSAYIKQYGDIKKAAIDAENEKDNTKKALALAQVRQSLSDLGSFSEGSKKQGIFERQLAMEHLKNPYLYDDDTAQKILAGKDKVWNSDGIIKDASQVVRGVNPVKADEDFDKDVVKQVQKASPVTFDNGTLSNSQNILGKKMATLTQRRVIPLMGDNGALEHAMHYATSNFDFQKTLQDRYPQIKGNDQQSTVGLRVLKYMQDRGYGGGFVETKSKDVEGYKPQEPVRFSALEEYNLRHYGNPNSPSKPGDTTSPTYRQAWVSGMLNGEPDSGQKLIAQVKADPTYNGALKIGQVTIKSTGKKLLEFHVPEKISYDKDGAPVSKIPAHTVEIDPTDPNAKITLNKMVSDVTGEKVDISALETPGGKKHVGGGSSKGGMVTVKLPDGRTGQIPSDKYDEFLKDNPKAQKVN